ncbi:MAG: RNA recognition motif-containing protein [Bogoriella megaspora]|nr:MAG: RNA recognition motif-containing protein [Bogoriella megaspora]
MAPSRKRRRLSDDESTSQTQLNIPPVTQDHNEGDPSEYRIQHRRTIFVRSLPPSTTNASFLSYFSQSYPIKHAMIVTDSSSKQCKGYGFVTFTDSEDAQRAVDSSNGAIFEGKKIMVEMAKPRRRDDELGERKSSGNSEIKATDMRESDLTARPPKLIVRNLPWSVNESDQLAKLFMSYGKVKNAVVPKKKDGKMLGFGIVLIRGRKNTEKAMQGLNGKEIDGRTIAVDWAVDKDTWEHQKDSIGDALATETDRTANATEGEAGHLTDEEQFSDGEGREFGRDADDEIASTTDPSDDEGDRGEEEEEESMKNSTAPPDQEDPNVSTLFVRNLPFSTMDEDLYDHFSQFGRLRYARVVVDPSTERSRGTGFVSFISIPDAVACMKNAPKRQNLKAASNNEAELQSVLSVLQNDLVDMSGKYTMEGRILQVSRAVNKSEAQRLSLEGEARQSRQQRDKRRLYLLSEGTISTKSPLYERLAPSEIKLREASAKQRKKLVESNPTLHLSLTRLSVRNVPRTVTSKDLKALAREAVVGFATDVKEGSRQPLSKEELTRGGDEMREAEKYRKARGKGVVKQAKVVFEGREGNKISEASGAGRSRGYGFIEYYTHRSALMGLRWLNGHSVAYQVHEAQGKKLSKEDLQDRKKRLIVEFAIENVQVVGRRKDRESKARDRANTTGQAHAPINSSNASGPFQASADPSKNTLRKRKRQPGQGSTASAIVPVTPEARPAERSKLAKREQIIARKRMARRGRKKAGIS